MAPRTEDIARAVAELAPEYGISRASLFGSCARGEQSGGSDIDLVVDLSRPLGFRRAELHEVLEERLGCSVDLIFGAEGLYAPVREGFERDKVVVYAA